MRNKIMPNIYIIIIPYIIISICYLLFRHYIPDISFSAHKNNLKATLSSYAKTIIAILIAALTFLIKSKTRQLAKIKKYRYITSIIIIYALNFIKLKALFFCELLLLSSISSYIIPTIAISIASASFIHICILIFQLYNLTKKQK